MPGILYFYDGEGRFLRWNKNFETVSGYSAEEIATMHPLDFFSEKDKAMLQARIGEVFERGESSVEAAFMSKDGTLRPHFFTGRKENIAHLLNHPKFEFVRHDVIDRRRQTAIEQRAGTYREHQCLTGTRTRTPGDRLGARGARAAHASAREKLRSLDRRAGEDPLQATRQEHDQRRDGEERAAGAVREALGDVDAFLGRSSAKSIAA